MTHFIFLSTNTTTYFEEGTLLKAFVILQKSLFLFFFNLFCPRIVQPYVIF